MTSKIPKRPLPVPPPVLPHKIDRLNDSVQEQKLDEPTTQPNTSSVERKQRKRKTKSVERLRDQSNDIELSDSDEEFAIKSQIPIITTTTVTSDCSIIDEPDASISISDPVTAISNNTTCDEPAICIDSNIIACNNDATNTFSDKSQISYDEILKIDESLDDDGIEIDTNPINQSIVVEIHDEPTIELKIHESDSDEGAFGAVKSTKEQINIELDGERCHSEDDAAIEHSEDDKEKAERLVQSDSEILSKTPLELVVQCDINENVVMTDIKSNEIIDIDYNHNDIVKSTENNVSNNNENEVSVSDAKKLVQTTEPIVQRNNSNFRVSISSRSSFDESDAEPMYATVDVALNMVSFIVSFI